MDRILLLNANALKIPLPKESVHCVVTSPPYWNLRDYDVEGQLGLETTLEEYIENTVLWGREIWRILRSDGTFWCNVGDTYIGSSRGGIQNYFGNDHSRKVKGGSGFNLKRKDLAGVPWRIALAFQSDGWYLRSDIIWQKPNPMPSSAQDRPSGSHEHMFLLAKNEKYFYDADAIREPIAESTKNDYRLGKIDYEAPRKDRGYPGSGSSKGGGLLQPHPLGPNKKDVWTITTKSYSGAHFATFPPKLVEPCIKAGTSEKGICPECGNPWNRITEVWYEPQNNKGYRTETPKVKGRAAGLDAGGISPQEMKHGTAYRRSKTIGWEPTCDHNLEPVPAVVFDPFGGSGTTAKVASDLGRIGIITELSMDYLQLAKERTGMKAMDEWLNGKEAEETDLDGLPLFEI